MATALTAKSGREARPRQRLPWLLIWLLAMQPLAVAWLAAAARGMPSDAEEQANCERVSQIVTDNSAPVMAALEQMARQRFGRSLSEVTPEQLVQLSMGADVVGRQMTAEQQRLQDRCTAYQQRVIAKQSAAAGIRSLFVAQGYLDRWGRERVAGLGCGCPDFRPAGEDGDQSCPSRPLCPGQQGGPRLPDPEGGCRSLGAGAWIRQQLPEFYRILAISPDSEEVRDVLASLQRQDPVAVCSPLPVPTAAALTFVSLSAVSTPATAPGPAFPAAIATAAACFANPSAASCLDALVRGDALVVSAQRAGRYRCLGYALAARTLWALGADPRFSDLLIRYPEATRLRNEARIALRYLRSDCRGL